MDEDRKMTKKELKALRRLERQEKEMTSGAGGGGKMKWFVIGIAVMLFVGFFAYMVNLSKQQQAEKAAKAAEGLTQNGTVRGDKNAQITLVEFADMQCPACQVSHPIVKQTLTDMKGKVKLVFKHFPLGGHQNAMAAAKAVEAAARQGKFWEMTDVLYAKQRDWEFEPNPQKKFNSYAQDLKLNVEQFEQDMSDPAITKKIESERDEGIRVGVNSTPTFFVNQKLVTTNPVSVEEFKAIITELSKK